MRTNYHTHTERCNHALGSDEEYVTHAIAGGYSLLGFSDHTPWCFNNGYTSRIRMAVKELEGYAASIRSLQAKYAPQIEIKLGLECEYYTAYTTWLQEMKEQYAIDYLLFGNHFAYEERGAHYFGSCETRAHLRLYLESSLAAMESGLFDCFAHPDLFMRNYLRVDDYCLALFRELSVTARETGVVMEFNTTQRYCPELWQIVAEEQPKVIIGMDCHNAKLLSNPAPYDAAITTLNKLGIVPIERL